MVGSLCLHNHLRLQAQVGTGFVRAMSPKIRAIMELKLDTKNVTSSEDERLFLSLRTWSLGPPDTGVVVLRLAFVSKSWRAWDGMDAFHVLRRNIGG